MSVAVNLVVLIGHIVDWNIQTRLSGERPRIRSVRLSVAYSTEHIDICMFARVSTGIAKESDTSSQLIFISGQ